MKDRWRKYEISEDASHHVYQGRPAYRWRFHEVLKFHEPGLAPVRDASGAYHITPEGLPAYVSRYIRTFGFYEGRAAVHSYDGWFHIIPDGIPLYGERFAWCGNFQEYRCTVRLAGEDYFHIAADGSPAYRERFRYAGDFKDGHAVVQREDGKHTHIDASGNLLHGRWFLDLDVFHKRYARACDSDGWHHVDMIGKPLYGERFKNVEPFYNGQARVEGFDGSLSVIDESGQTLLELRRPSQSHLEGLSADMVGLWRTQTIHSAVELGVFELLPASAAEVERQARLHRSIGTRLMRALMELGLVWRDTEGSYYPTERGSILTRKHPLSLADALDTGVESPTKPGPGSLDHFGPASPPFERLHGENFFDWIQDRPSICRPTIRPCRRTQDTTIETLPTLWNSPPTTVFWMRVVAPVSWRSRCCVPVPVWWQQLWTGRRWLKGSDRLQTLREDAGSLRETSFRNGPSRRMLSSWRGWCTTGRTATLCEY